mmetsp:Transcript_8383/g.20845  ORF Transcript_8383/g.20845 Transcript_8383/m.20845 type:complete len:229 (-) Transcript_8383:616-1302(-)
MMPGVAQLLLPIFEAALQEVRGPVRELQGTLAVVISVEEDGLLRPPVHLRQLARVGGRDKSVLLRMGDQDRALAVLRIGHHVDGIDAEASPVLHRIPQGVDGALHNRVLERIKRAVAHAAVHVEQRYLLSVGARELPHDLPQRRVAAVQHHPGNHVVVTIRRGRFQRRAGPHAPPMQRNARYPRQPPQIVQDARKILALRVTQGHKLPIAQPRAIEVEREHHHAPLQV